MFGDVTTPTFPGRPVSCCEGGTCSTAYAPVTLTYRAADDVRVGSLNGTAPAKAALSVTSTSWNSGVRPNTTTTFTISAKDWPGRARRGELGQTLR
ncbi:hypothetical protein GCM10010172_61150 [Paractinoplanes ferrugineus]|uniref:Uncharacterized protein n=1 Tax=Paractinoplanes ferrugineus TaxID=113564 RepID=A0A919J751_9ACTN|nr:hypothetical protein Afe05nite_63970 [Actinoplanes ferrugineus]